MTGVVTTICKTVRLIVNRKGQGVVEFALLCAFCVGIGLFVRDVGFSDAIDSSYSAGKPDLLTAAIGNKYVNHNDGGEQQSEDKGYLDYYRLWHDMNSTDLEELSNEERKRADQLALCLIAQNFIGKDEDGVFDLMALFSNKSQNENQTTYDNTLRNAIKENKSQPGGYSSGMLVPLSYSKNTLDNNNGYLWLEKNNNINTIKSIVGDEAEVYDREDTSNPNYDKNSLKTACLDRLFYSHDMLDSGQKTVSLRLHYNANGVVDEVIISARSGGVNSKGETMGEGLCINVTDTGYTENNQFVSGAGKADPVRNPWAYL